MNYASILVLSSAAAAALTLGSCSSDDSTPAASGAAGSAMSGAAGAAGTTTTNGAAGTTPAGTGGASAGSAGSGGSTGGGGSGGSAGTAAGGAGGAGGTVVGLDASTDVNVPDVVIGGDGGAAKAVANIMPLPGGTITGTATFTASGADVTLVVALTNCPEGVHPMHIHAGTGCADMATQGAHWDPPRGENIGMGTGQITCLADMTAMLTYTRLGTDPKPWTIGGPVASNVIGHPIIVHGVGDGNTMRHGCGVIQGN